MERKPPIGRTNRRQYDPKHKNGHRQNNGPLSRLHRTRKGTYNSKYTTGKIMCLYPKLVRNPRYTETSKNGGNIPPVHDERVLYVPYSCGNCMECRKQNARQWQVRLMEDIKVNKEVMMITLTFSNESYSELYHKIIIENMKLEDGDYLIDNLIATQATRYFLERWRKKHKKSLRHWLVTELGHEGTENIHLHGLIWNKDYRLIEKLWQYGYVWPGSYVNMRTVNYIVKYVNKADADHPTYKSIILTSAGIGASYINDSKLSQHNANKFNGTPCTLR
eukprot:gnl/Spiro4/18160_TR9695_c0_g1_i1.p1 gnl/Spiro4/18160_TR9695_c0_g1~~gnl/Spiro4/18160_TR9695_c0_g1_i1.p1  ORF type:complete len:277 (-),score=-54.91 gnl/Spiro4/18160_TR9695_c0_g1_i1:3-833(-)